jgi:hypothetical protein
MSLSLEGLTKAAAFEISSAPLSEYRGRQPSRLASCDCPSQWLWLAAGLHSGGFALFGGRKVQWACWYVLGPIEPFVRIAYFTLLRKPHYTPAVALRKSHE